MTVPTLAEEAVEALGDAFGRYPGCRASHAKGIVCRGSFRARPQAARLTRASHMQGDPVEVMVRFSNASGDPHSPDWARDVRGMATKFHLRDGSRTDLVAVTLPCFLARTPEDLIRFARTRRASPRTGRRGFLRTATFVLTHPEAFRATRAAVTMRRVPSYANCRYNAIHAFRWVDSAGGERNLRYSWLPHAGESAISVREAKAGGDDYLQDELREHLRRGPVRFTLCLQLAEEGDPLEDPTAVWRQRIEPILAGDLELTDLDTRSETGGDLLVFDPTRLTDGIELSGDPILRFRHEAYSVSVENRGRMR